MVDGQKSNLYNCFENSLRDLRNLYSRNVVSVITKLFMDCFLEVAEKGDREVEGYITKFSRFVVEKLYEEFKCSNIQGHLQQVSSYLETVYNELASIFDSVVMFKLVLQSRLSVGTRNPLLPLEISVEWDPILNVPYIPSSTLKGAVRAYLELNNVRDVDGVATEAIFGSSPGSRQLKPGLVVFTDAYPVACGMQTKSLLDPDIITPHYREASGCIDETCVKPTPLAFPTLARGVELRFVMAIDSGCSETREKCVLSLNTIMKIVEYVRRALEKGVGAKTSVGYGRIKAEIAKQNTAPKKM